MDPQEDKNFGKVKGLNELSSSPDTTNLGIGNLALKTSLFVIVAIILIGGVTYLVSNSKTKKQDQNNAQSKDFGGDNNSLSAIQKYDLLRVSRADSLDVNGRLQVNNTVVLSPTTVPNKPVTGQIYYDKYTNTPYYYNGKTFIPLTGSISGTTGSFNIGSGLNLANSTISNSGVISIQGQTGDFNFKSGVGVSINGSTISNTGVLGIAGNPNQLGVSSIGGNVVISVLGIQPGGVLVGTTNNGITTALPALPGQCLISDGSNKPTFATCPGGGGPYVESIDAGSGQITGALSIQGSGGISVSSAGTVISIDGSSITLPSNYIGTLGVLSGLTTSGNSGQGSTPSLSVVYGNTTNTAVQGNMTLTCPTGIGNLSGGGNTIILGSGGSCNNLTAVNSPTFNGTLAVQGVGGITVGTASIQGALTLNTGGGTAVTLQSNAQAANVILSIPSTGITDTICLQSVANCTTAGGLTSSSGVANYIPRFTGATTLTAGSIYDDGTLVAIGSSTGSSLLTIGTNTTTAVGGITFGTDTNVYRLASNILKTDGSLQVGLNGQFQMLGSGGSISSIRTVGTSDMTFRVGGTDRAIIDSSGNFGIGITSPSGRLSVIQGNALSGAGRGVYLMGEGGGASSAGGSVLIGVGQNGAGSTNGSIRFGVASPNAESLQGTTWLTLSSSGAATFQNASNSTTAFQIQNAAGSSNLFVADTQNNRIGIGIANPQTTLHSMGTITIGYNSGIEGYPGVMQLTTGGASPTSNRLIFGTDGTSWGFAISKNQVGTITDLITVKTNGNVGIGTTSPQVKLDVQVASGNVLRLGTASNYISYVQQNTTQYGWLVGGGGYVQSWDLANARTSFGTTSLPLSTIDVNGNAAIGTYAGTSAAPANGLIVSGSVGIGLTNPASKLEVKDSTSVTSFLGASKGILNVQGGGNVSEYTSLTLSDYNGTPTGKIAVLKTNNGSYMQFGTSNNWTNGITNMAISIHYNGSTCLGGSTCNGSSRLGVLGNATASGAFTSYGTPDIAETIPSAPDVEAADVVSADPNNTERAIKSTKPYDSSAIGVISDGSSAFLINSYGGEDINGPLTGKPLVLAGRVPVKVTDEGGSIRPGDYLTTSSTPGKAMKATRAGPTIGKALGSFDGESGTVLVLVNLSYHNPFDGNNLQGQGGDFADLNASGTATIQNLVVTGIATFRANIIVEGHIITGGNSPYTEALIAAGTGATVAIDGNDTGGTLTITIGSGATAGDLGRFIFSNPFGKSPKVILSPQDDASYDAKIFPSGKSTTQFNLKSSQVLPAGTYTFDYFIVQ